MARLPRFTLPGVPQHIVQRGNNRQPCFFADEDYLFYLECIGNASQCYGCAVHAYVLMTNHVHLLVTQADGGSISRFMQHIGRRYVQYVNFHYHRSGTLWEGRYKASLVNADEYLLTCYRYIEMNPVRANMVESPGAYRWSSYGYNALGRSNPIITPHAGYLMLSSDPESRQHAYRELFRQHLDSNILHDIRGSLNQEVALGNQRFRDGIEAALTRRAHPTRRGRPAKQGEVKKELA